MALLDERERAMAKEILQAVYISQLLFILYESGRLLGCGLHAVPNNVVDPDLFDFPSDPALTGLFFCLFHVPTVDIDQFQIGVSSCQNIFQK